MEAQPKLGYAMETPSQEPARARAVGCSRTVVLSFVLRLLAVKLTLVAAIVVGLMKQKVAVQGVDLATGDYVTISQTGRSTDSSSFVYFIVVNSIACVYSALSLALSIASRTNFGGGVEAGLSVADLVMVVLLFSGSGAAAGIAIVAENGNDNFGWGKFCNVAGKFCAHMNSSIVTSMLAALAYAILVLVAVIRRSRR